MSFVQVDERDVLRRHSRESGNPFSIRAESKLDSRFRGNDVAVGMVRVVSGVAV